jgi:hypothetical protein
VPLFIYSFSCLYCDTDKEINDIRAAEHGFRSFMLYLDCDNVSDVTKHTLEHWLNYWAEHNAYRLNIQLGLRVAPRMDLKAAHQSFFYYNMRYGKMAMQELWTIA